MSTGQPISEIEKINKKLVLNTNKALSDFDIKNGLKINGCHIQLDNIYNENNNFTMFVSFKHNTSFTDTTYTMGFGNNINRNLIIHFAPYIQVENNKFSLIKSHPPHQKFQSCHSIRISISCYGFVSAAIYMNKVYVAAHTIIVKMLM